MPLPKGWPDSEMPIERGFSVGDWNFLLLSMTKEGENTFLWVIRKRSSVSEDLLKEEERIQREGTLRDLFRFAKPFTEQVPIPNISELYLGDQSYLFSGFSGYSVVDGIRGPVSDLQRWTAALRKRSAELGFMDKESTHLFDSARSLEEVDRLERITPYFFRCYFVEKNPPLPTKMETDSPARLCVSFDRQEHYLDSPLRYALPIDGKGLQKKQSFTDQNDKKHVFYIDGLRSYDIWGTEDRFAAERAEWTRRGVKGAELEKRMEEAGTFYEGICPPSHVLCLLLHACEEDENAFSPHFYSTKRLDTPIAKSNDNSGAMGLSLASQEKAWHGLQTRVANLGQVPQDSTEPFSFELVSWSNAKEDQWIELF